MPPDASSVREAELARVVATEQDASTLREHMKEIIEGAALYPSGKHTVDSGREASLIRDCQDCVREWIQAVGVSSGTRWMGVLASPGRMVPR
jgi:hypothetical protein